MFGVFGQFLSFFFLFFFSIFYDILLRVLDKMFSLGRFRKTESHMIWCNVNRWPRHIV